MPDRQRLDGRHRAIANHTLRARAERTVVRIAGVGENVAKNALEQTGYSVKEAALLLRCGLDPAGARELLAAHGGHFRAALHSGSPN